MRGGCADLDLCQAHQMCLIEAPEVFGFDEDADQVVVLDEHPDERCATQVDGAVRYCPAMACRWRRTDGSTRRPRGSDGGVLGAVARGQPGGRGSGATGAILADYYAEDATYGWMYTPDEHFMAVGREEIREVALGTEMAGLDGWHYDYVAHGDGRVERDGHRLLEAARRHRRTTRPAGSTRSSASAARGSGSSTAPDGFEIGWQRDWFDLGSTAHTFLEIAGSGKAPQGLLDRMALDGMSQPGHYRHATCPRPSGLRWWAIE